MSCIQQWISWVEFSFFVSNFFLIPVAETYETEPKNRHALITKNRKDENEIEAGIL